MNLYKNIGLIVLLSGLASVANAQQNRQPAKPDSLTLYYQGLARSGTTEDKVKITTGLKQLADKDEAGITQATKIAVAIKATDMADSLRNVTIKRYPHGQAAFIKQYNELVSVKATAAEKEKKYDLLIKQFPEPAQNADVAYDYARSEVAYSYALEGNAAKCEQWVETVKSPSYLATIRTMNAQTLASKNEFATAERMIRKSVAAAKSAADAGSGNKDAYYANVSALANVLYKEQKFKDALTFATEAYEGSTRKTGSVKTVYALALTANNRGKDALPMLVEEVKAGRANADIKASLKAAYVQDKGSDTGYTEFIGGLSSELQKAVLAGLSKKMISEASPEFALVDLNGAKVSLASLKGKVVILDFWATWCGPCKKSFPAMQMALTKYKNDPNVKFLFIDTWERVPDPAKDVKSFIKDNKYDFQVLLDDNKTKVVDKFGITGIPAKFVIDGNGKIRFKLTGFDGADDAAVEEISAMIEMAKKTI
ncbi:redoxin domain-containing protein [Mucilaginibacter mali]|uniref:Redoxin domain-containing protein n=1 Tax=Mucilaginibacter mali TaxID=2740462 RepID=A0A7D4QBD3_9SPHI|nr:redoxin domain-containing protein [Mucilaginibacter mali]QKJ32591.1 redoxin domain-containing protein [Mucilaginibacter mali]